MIQGDFQQIVGSETIGSFHGDLHLVIKTLYTSERDLSFGTKPVKQEFPVIAQHLGHLLHRLEPGSHGSCTPCIEELSGPGGRAVFPEALKVLFGGHRGRAVIGDGH